jgi:hypothetical protein
VNHQATFFDDLKRIAGTGYLYVATPYSKYPGGLNAAYDDACIAAASLISEGVAVFCPIAHSHGIANQGIDHYSHEVWMRVDHAMMASARGLVVVQMPGWKESRGVTEEIARFVKDGKPIVYMEWPL